MKLRIQIVASIVSLTAVIGCSNGKFIYGKALGDISSLTGVTTGLEETDPTLNEVAVTARAEGPPLIVGFNEIRVAIPLAGRSGESLTYVAPDGVVIAMNKGFVTRTSGLGTDLNGSYLPFDSPLFNGLGKAANDNAQINRVFEYWEESRAKRDSFSCSLNIKPRETGGSVIDETCKRYFEDEGFVNRYWIKADDTIECSRQWIHPKLAPLQFFETEQQALSLDLTKSGC